MPNALSSVVRAIISRVQEREGYTNKTKLVKFLYLFDVAHYRRTGRTLTGFPWRFHLYGPWADDFEALYQELTRNGDIEVTTGNRIDLDTEFLRTGDRVDVTNLVDDVTLGFEFRHIVDQWADRRLGEMLDYVYFHTEPMEAARRGDYLDFSTVRRDRVEQRFPERARIDRRVLKRLKRGVERREAESAPEPEEFFTPPRYDEIYERARRMMEDEEDAY